MLIKDNHIVSAGGITAALRKARHRAPHTCRIEIEVESLAELDEALTERADIVLLDNFAPELHPGRPWTTARRVVALVEVSGGITLERVADLSRAGIDFISVGALTHPAPSADIGLDFERV